MILIIRLFRILQTYRSSANTVLFSIVYSSKYAGPGSSVGCVFGWYSGGRGFDLPVRQDVFVETGHEIIFTAILSQPLIQVGQ